MGQRDLARILIRIAGLIFIVRALIGLPSTVLTTVGMLSRLGQSTPWFPGTAVRLELWAIGIVPVSYLAVGLALFLFAGRIADRIVDRQRNEITFQGGWRAWEETAVAVLGLYSFVEGIFDAAGLAVAALTQRGYVINLVVSTALKLGFGIALMLGARGLVALRLRLIAFRNRTKADTA
jgi:hypothetical protein